GARRSAPPVRRGLAGPVTGTSVDAIDSRMLIVLLLNDGFPGYRDIVQQPTVGCLTLGRVMTSDLSGSPALDAPNIPDTPDTPGTPSSPDAPDVAPSPAEA